MKRSAWFAAVLALPFAALAQDASTHGQKHQPYAGQQSRAIKALSAQEVDDLVAGRGMGTARAAELNRYPGPAHVLELQDRLGLTPEQVSRAHAIQAHMQAQATAAGQRVVAAERTLDEAFAKGAIDEASLTARVLEVGQLQAEFRLAHLQAHLEMKGLLTPEQVARYDGLRGYSGNEAHDAHKRRP